MTTQSESTATNDSQQALPVPKRRRFRVALAWTSLLLAIALIVIHHLQPDSLAAVTLIPPWMWLVPAAMVLAISFRDTSRMIFFCSVIAWFAFALLFAEEATSLLRFQEQSISHSAEVKRADEVRVVTLNCNMGSGAAAKETRQFNADIILFQESLGDKPLLELSKRFYGETGSHVYGGDVSIVANGTLNPIHVDRASHFVHAHISLENGLEFDVVSLRLSPPVFRIDFWTQGFWHDHDRTRKKHRQQLKEVVDHLASTAKTENWIVGGDFNLVGNDGALSSFTSGSTVQPMQDTFSQSGTGWCNTGTNDYPLFRVDQIWVSASLKGRCNKSYKTENSDHRMVVSDLNIE